MLRSLFSIAMIMHGIGHVLFLANGWGYWRTPETRSALFASMLHLAPGVEGVAGVLWIVPLTGFLITGWGFAVDAYWWPMTGFIVALVSTLMIILWWNGINASSAWFALLFNLIVAGVVMLRPAFLSAY
jgi:hypothetical protein